MHDSLPMPEEEEGKPSGMPSEHSMGDAHAGRDVGGDSGDPAPSHSGHDMPMHAGHEMPAHAGHGMAPPSDHGMPGGHVMSGSTHQMHRAGDFQRRFWICLPVTLPILALSPNVQALFGLHDALRFPGDLYVLFALSSFVFFCGGWPFLKGIVEELRGRRPGMMTLVAVAITTAYLYSSAVVFGLHGEIFFWELATLVDIMLLGHWIEIRAVLGASRALEELARLMPSDAHMVASDGSVRDVPLGELAKGMRVLVKPGEKVPADGRVVDGETSVNEAMLTGESQPVFKAAGAGVVGGSINGEGAISVEVTRTGDESYLAQVIELVRQAQVSRSRTQDLADRAASWLTLVAVGGGAITLAVWLGLQGRDLSFALERTVTVMVIACPHALGLAVPLVVAVSTSLSAKRGLLIRDRAAFERARGIQAILFDKTGTLTEGRFGVTDTVVFSVGVTQDELLAYAATVEANSEHPIAAGVAAASSQRLAAQGFRAMPGKGAEATVNGHDVKVVSPGYLREAGIEVNDARVDALAAQGKTVVFVVLDGRVAGAVALADIVRPESRQAVAALQEMGIRCMMLTGDSRRVAQWVAHDVGLDEYFAEVLPQDKVQKVKEVQSRGLVVAMTGDGVNDAPALAQADVGIAIGAGTDVAIETADIILVRSNPMDVVAIIGLARATYGKMVQNLAWATGYNAFAIPIAAGVLYGAGILLSPALGAALMSLSTMIVAVNARFLRMPR